MSKLNVQVEQPITTHVENINKKQKVEPVEPTIDSSIFIQPYYPTNVIHKNMIDSCIQIFQLKTNLNQLDSTLNLNWEGTINFGMRKPNFVIIHHTAQKSCEQTLQTFTNPKTQVSAHYVICKDGTIHQMLNDYFRAQHAGIAQWGQLTDLNSASIGIELDNDGFTPFDSLQIQSLIKLLTNLKIKYNIPTANFIGHGDIAPIRKNDPNIFFPWKYLSSKGFGLWAEVNDSIPVEDNFSVNNALRLIGYNIQDSTAAFLAFKRHFRQDTANVKTYSDKNVLKQLIKY